MSELLEVDGSVLEGGGQILRNTIALSAILGIPVKITNIRAGRSKPGLAAQHLKGIELVATMCKAKLNGACLGSTEVQFEPGVIHGGQYAADTKTAGSISLLLQTVLPCALFATWASRFELRGGTNADMAPQIDYMNEVFAYVLRRFNANFSLTVHKRGYFPRGGGRVTVEVDPVVKLQNIEMTERGDVTAIQGWSFVAGTLPLRVAQEQTEGAREVLRTRRYDVRVDSYKEHREHAPDNCNGIILVCESSTGCVLGSSALRQRDCGPRAVGASAAEDILRELDTPTCVDMYAQDQIIIYMALADGRSVVRTGEVTLHTKTAIHVAELLAKVKFTIQQDGDSNLISCTGLGVVNRSDKI